MKMKLLMEDLKRTTHELDSAGVNVPLLIRLTETIQDPAQIVDVYNKYPTTCGDCEHFHYDCEFCCHPPVKADQTPPSWCPYMEV